MGRNPLVLSGTWWRWVFPSYLRCPLHRRQVLEAKRIGRQAVKRAMRPAAIVEVDIPSNPTARSTDFLVGAQVDLFILGGFPEPLYKYVAAPAVAAIHA